MQYQYVAVDSKNKHMHGQLTANSKTEVIAQLQTQGLVALEVSSVGDTGQPTSIWDMEIGSSDPHNVKIPKQKLMTMMHQMSIMMKSGVSLSIAMNVLIDSEKDKHIKSILKSINDDLFTGVAISDAMAKFKTFPEITINILRSGESNGHLDTAFARCASILQKELEMTAKIRGAMSYPLFLLVLTIVLVGIMNGMVLPQFSDLFASFGASLPALTKTVMAVSTFFTHEWFLIALVIAAVVVTFRLLKKKVEAFALKTDQMNLKVPIIGNLLRKSYTARFCRTMSSLVEGGVDIVHAIEISSQVIPNRYMRQQLLNVADDVRLGSSINASMNKYPVFDSLLVSMVRVGEESGMLFETMDKMANLYEEQTDDAAKQLTTMMEPTMTIIIAVIVGTVIISIVMPMFGMYSVVAGNGK